MKNDIQDIKSEWDELKNGISFLDVKLSSSKKAWWKCKHGHSWEAKIYSRKVSGCPYCSGRFPTKERNLLILDPEVAKEWHPTKNFPLTPDKISYGSGKKVWWMCKNSHEWEAVVSSRTYKRVKNGCPLCSKGNGVSKIELRIYAELKTLFDSVEHGVKIFGKEWDIILPRNKIAIEFDGHHWHKGRETFDHNKTDFITNKGFLVIRIRQAPLNRITQNDILVGQRESDLAIIHKLVEKLEEITKKSFLEYKKANVFKNENEYLNLLSDISFPDKGKSLGEVYPKSIEIWDYTKNGKLTPYKVCSGSHQKIWCKCIRGHSWENTASNIRRGEYCPYCANQKVCKDNSLDSLFPHIAEQWNFERNGGLTPDTVTKSSGRKVWWRCSFGHEWDEVIGNRTKQKTGCPYCSGRRRIDNVCMAEMSAKGIKMDAPKKKTKKVKDEV